MLFYWAKMFEEQLNPGNNFGELKKTITINEATEKLICLNYNLLIVLEKYV